MNFNFFATGRVFHVGQYDGIDDLVALDLSGEKCALVEFFDGEFHPSVICQSFNPLIAHSGPPNWRFTRDNTPIAPHNPTSARVQTDNHPFYRIRAMKGRKTAKTYADYLREQPSRLSDFERESRAAEALLRDERQKKAPQHWKPTAQPPK